MYLLAKQQISLQSLPLPDSKTNGQVHLLGLEITVIFRRYKVDHGSTCCLPHSGYAREDPQVGDAEGRADHNLCCGDRTNLFDSDFQPVKQGE